MSNFDTTTEGRRAALDKAREMGFIVVEGAPNQLLLDMDDGRLPDQKMLDKLTELYGPHVIEEWPSKSGKGKHVVITFHGKNRSLTWYRHHVGDERFKDPGFSDDQATALEIALGSDPLRGMLQIMRVRNGAWPARILFRPGPDVKIGVAEAFEDATPSGRETMFAAAARIMK